MKFLQPFIKLDLNYTGSSQKIVPLDGLRGFAVLLVVIFHCFGLFKISYFGWMGVDLFFVLSGFLITGILLDGKESKNYYKNFIGKRALRIFPLYYFVLFLLTLLAAFKVLGSIYTLPTPSIYYWLYIQNWQITSWGKFETDDYILNHLWSLAIEEQFYIFWPFLIRNCKAKTLYVVITFFIVLAIGVRMYLFANNNIGYYVNTFARLDSLCIGSLIAVLIRFNPEVLKKYVFYIFIISGAFILCNAAISGPFFAKPLTARFGYTINSLFWGALLLYSISYTTFLSKLFSLKFLTFFGKYSYGIYVYHAIIYLVFNPTLAKKLAATGLDPFIAFITSGAILVLISILVSVISFNYFEKYFLKYKKHFHN